MQRAFLAPYYRLLREVAPPAVVDTFTPSHVAAIMGWDQQRAIRAVPLTDEEVAAGTRPPTVAPPVDAVPATPDVPQPRIRRIF